MDKKKTLQDILGSKEKVDALRARHQSVVDNKIPTGEFLADVISIRLDGIGKNCTPGCFVDFGIREGKAKGKNVSMPLYLTDAATDRTMATVEPLGIKKIDELENDIPPGIVARVTIKSDDFRVTNTGVVVSRFEIVSSNGTAKAPVISNDISSTPSMCAPLVPKKSEFHTTVAKGWSDAAFDEVDTAISS